MMDNEQDLFELDFGGQTLSKEDHASILSQFRLKLEELVQQRSEVEKRWVKCEKVYDNKFSADVKGLEDPNTVPHARQVVNTLSNQLWYRACAAPSAWFALSGRDSKGKEAAPVFEAYLKQKLEKSNFKETLRKVVHHGLVYGMGVCVIEYDVQHRARRKLNIEASRQLGQKVFYEEQEACYEGASSRWVHPSDFYFDVTTTPFECAFKIIASYATKEELERNYGAMAQEAIDRLFTDGKSSTYPQRSLEAASQNKFSKKKFLGSDKVPVYECYGDFRLADGTLVENIRLVVVDEAFVVCFKKNEFYECPVFKWVPKESEDGYGDGGILYESSGLIEGYNNFMKRFSLGLDLQVSPCYLAPESMFDGTSVVLSPGKIITYTPNMTTGAGPVPVSTDVSPYANALPLYENALQSTTGAVRQLAGGATSDGVAQTATEFQGLSMSSNVAMDRMVDDFNTMFKLPMIEAIARLQGAYGPEEKEMEVEHDFGVKKANLTYEHFQQEYDFVITDSKNKLEEKQLAQQRIQLLQLLMTLPNAGSIDFQAVVKPLMADLGWPNVSELYMTDLKRLEREIGQAGVQAVAQSLQQQILAKFTPLAPMLLQKAWEEFGNDNFGAGSGEMDAGGYGSVSPQEVFSGQQGAAGEFAAPAGGGVPQSPNGGEFIDAVPYRGGGMAVAAEYGAGSV